MLLLTRAVERRKTAQGDGAAEPLEVIRAEPSPAAPPAAGRAALRTWVGEQLAPAMAPGDDWTLHVRGDAETCRFAADLLAASGVTTGAVGRLGPARRHVLDATLSSVYGDLMADLLEAVGSAEEVRIAGSGRRDALCVVYQPRLAVAAVSRTHTDGHLKPTPEIPDSGLGAPRRTRHRRVSRRILVAIGLAIGTACAGMLALVVGDGRPPGGASPRVVAADAGPPPTEPPARRVPAAVYDSARRQLVVVGGVGASSGLLSDTWTFDGRRWSRHDAGPQPPARIGASLVYDPRAGRVLLVGGLRFTVVSLSDDIWAWNGTTWSRLETVGAAPQPILPGVAAWDSTLKSTVFVGICRNAGAAPDVQTWAFDGQRWLSLRPAHEPPLRHGALLSDAPRVGSLVLVEPDGEGGDRGQTWTFDGIDWRSASGPARVADDESVVVDPLSGLLVLTGPSGDSATWDGFRWRDAASRVPQWQAIPFSDGSRLLLVASDVGQPLRTWAWNGHGWTQTRLPRTLPDARHA